MTRTERLEPQGLLVLDASHLGLDSELRSALSTRVAAAEGRQMFAGDAALVVVMANNI